ncbi:ABC transporter substrate-binding protein [Streptomyces sp. NBC_00873]|uniref:ABC transporter substrate-binding protein n=1 Tax=unclassified Streptomyces TaxID=2593676 RepID=UPI0038674A9D|nr:ABC transporter substrate-binding protein [Streptomyces sp. NBC_00873]WTA41982.1 ABC transporter substrate-binding protein [Streptomyces sp. NBC_00842]
MGLDRASAHDSATTAGTAAGSRMPKKSRRIAAVGAAIVAFTAIASGCSSDDDGKKGSSSGGGAPIKLMVQGAISGPVYTVPEMVTGAQAAVNRINSEGGINGRKLELIPCDDQGNPNNAKACGRKAVSERVAAVVGGLSMYDNQFIPTLESAKIPYIGSTGSAPIANTNPVSFPVSSGAVSYLASGKAMARNGCKKAAVFAADQPGVDSAIENITRGLNQSGVTEVKPYKFPTSTSNFSSLVGTAQAAGAECIGISSGPQALAGIMLAVKKSGTITPINTILSNIVPELLKTVEFPAGKLTADGLFYMPDADATGRTQQVLGQYVADIAGTKATGQAAAIDGPSINGYNSVLLFAALAKTLPDITAEKVLNAMGSFKSDTGLTTPIDFSGKGPIEGAPQVHATTAITYSWTGTRLQLSGDPITVP